MRSTLSDHERVGRYSNLNAFPRSARSKKLICTPNTLAMFDDKYANALHARISPHYRSTALSDLGDASLV